MDYYPETVDNFISYMQLNNIYGSFVSGVADFLRTELFPRSKDVIISTYAKSIEYVRKRKAGGENWSPSYPFIVVDPQFNFEPEERHGRSFHNYPGFMNKFATKLWDPPIYKDKNVLISPVLTRYKGTIDVIVWCASVYEAIDMKILIHQYFGGYGRPIYPKSLDSLIIIPNELRYYTYNNPYKAETYPLDWSKYSENSNVVLIRNIDKDRMTFPFSVTPYITLTSVSDGVDKYGGGDSLGENRITFSMEWECAIPTHIIAKVEKWPVPCKQMQIEMFVTDFKYIDTEMGRIMVPEDKIIYSHPTILTDASTMSPGDFHMTEHDLEYKDTLNYILTASDVSSLNDSSSFDFSVDKYINDCVEIVLVSKVGKIPRDFGWKLIDSSSIRLYGSMLHDQFSKDDVINIIRYVPSY